MPPHEWEVFEGNCQTPRSTSRASSIQRLRVEVGYQGSLLVDGSSPGLLEYQAGLLKEDAVWPGVMNWEVKRKTAQFGTRR